MNARYTDNYTEELQQFCSFIEQCRNDTASVNEESVTGIADSIRSAGNQERLLLLTLIHAMTSTAEPIKQQAMQEYLRLLKDVHSNNSLGDFLLFIMEDNREFDEIRAVMIRMLHGELRTSTAVREHDVVKFLISLRKIFHLSYTDHFVDEAIRCLHEITNRQSEYFSDFVGKMVFQWFNRALDHGQAPLVTEQALTRNLSQVSWFETPEEYLQSIYRRLEGETDPRRLVNMLDLLAAWYEILPYRADSEGTEALIDLFNRHLRGMLDEEKDQVTRILEASFRVRDRIVEIVKTFSGDYSICSSAFNVLKQLPSSRHLLDHKDPSLIPGFITNFRNESRIHVFREIMGFLSCFVSGVTVKLPKEHNEEADSKELTYWKLLKKTREVFKLQRDASLIEEIIGIIYDSTEFSERRHSALQCLLKIDPAILNEFIRDFCRTHPIDDPLVPAILEYIRGHGEYDHWHLCDFYLNVCGMKKETWPYMQLLMDAAAKTGNPEMRNHLVRIALDHDDRAIRDAARRNLTKAGLGIFIELEQIQRDTRKLHPELLNTYDGLRTNNEKKNKAESATLQERTKMQIQRSNWETGHLELQKHVSDYTAYATDKRIDLGILDDRLDELNKKIDSLTKRRLELETQRNNLIHEKDLLAIVLESCKENISAEKRNIRVIENRIDSLDNDLSRLRNTLHELQARHVLMQLNAQDVHQTEGNNISKLNREHYNLQVEEDSCIRQRNNLTDAYNSNVNELNRLQYDENDLNNNLNRLTVRARNSDGEDYGLDTDIADLKGQLSAVRKSIVNSKHSLNVTQSEIINFDARINSLYREEERIIQMIGQSESRIRSAEQQLNDVLYDIQTCNGNIADVTGQISAQNSLLSDALERLARLKEEERKLVSRIEILKEREIEIHRELVPLIRDWEQAKREFDRINSEREDELRNMEKTIAKTKKERDALEVRLNKRQNELDALSDNLRKLSEKVSALLEREATLQDTYQQQQLKLNDLMKKHDSLFEEANAIVDKKIVVGGSAQVLARMDKDIAGVESLEYIRYFKRMEKLYTRDLMGRDT